MTGWNASREVQPRGKKQRKFLEMVKQEPRPNLPQVRTVPSASRSVDSGEDRNGRPKAIPLTHMLLLKPCTFLNPGLLRWDFLWEAELKKL